MPPTTPVITSATTASGAVNQAFSYQITASNSPTSYNATGLPAGLSVNTGTGAITGTPTGAGTTSVTLSATNAGGTGTATLTVTITALPAAPVITSATTASGTVNQAFTYQIVATNSPTSYNATPLPAGLAINTGTGAITGTPTAAGTTSVTLSATNAGGTGTATLTLTVNSAAAPTVVAPASGPAAPVAAGIPAQFSVLGGPAGIESGLIYTWSVVSGPAGGTVTFSPNGTNAAKNPQATFSSSGTYQVQVAIYNPANGTSSVSGPITVAVSVAPATASDNGGKKHRCGLGSGFSIFLLFGFGFLCLVSTPTALRGGFITPFCCAGRSWAAAALDNPICAHHTANWYGSAQIGPSALPRRTIIPARDETGYETTSKRSPRRRPKRPRADGILHVRLPVLTGLTLIIVITRLPPAATRCRPSRIVGKIRALRRIEG